MTRPVHWHLITSEYPPDPGGVADYTRAVAHGLATRGASVAVWAPGAGTVRDAHLTVSRPARRFGPLGVARLGAALDRCPRPRRLWVQYTPHGWGFKGLNALFGAWLLWRRLARRDEVWVLFHEVAYPWETRPRRRLVLGAVTRVGAALAGLAAGRVLATVPAWARLLRGLGVRKPVTVTPVPAPVTGPAPVVEIADVRGRHARSGRPLVGHFGTFGPLVTDLLGPALAALLAARPDVDVLLVGAGEAWAAGWLAGRDLAGRVRVTGRVPADQLAATLGACDVLLQPFADGASGRRTTLAAALAVGVPAVTTSGAATEAFWHAGAVRLAPVGDAAGLAAAAIELLGDPAARLAIGAAGRALYDDRFALDKVLDALLTAEVGA